MPRSLARAAVRVAQGERASGCAVYPMTRHQAALDRNSLITSVAHAVEALRAARAAAGKSTPDAEAPARSAALPAGTEPRVQAGGLAQQERAAGRDRRGERLTRTQPAAAKPSSAAGRGRRATNQPASGTSDQVVARANGRSPAASNAEAGPAGAAVPPLRRNRPERVSSSTPADSAVLEPLQAHLRVRPVTRVKPGLRAVTKTPSQPGLDPLGAKRSGASRPGETDQGPQKPGYKQEIKSGQTSAPEMAQGAGEGGVAGVLAGGASLGSGAAGAEVTARGLECRPTAAIGAQSVAQPGGAGPSGAQPAAAAAEPVGQASLVAEGPSYTAELELRGSNRGSFQGTDPWGGQGGVQWPASGHPAPPAPLPNPSAITLPVPTPSGEAALTELGPNNGEEQRQQLWREYRRQPNDQSRNLLVEAYQPLVREIVARFGARLPRTVDRGDLATAANMGLIAAIQSFDGARGVRFEAYGDRRIRGALLDELRTQDWLPRPWRRRLERHKQALERLCSELGREPHDEEVATALGLSLSDYQGLFGLGWPVAPSGGGGGGGADGDEDGPPAELDVFADPRAASPGEALTREELLTLCAQRMSAQEHQIVHLKYWEELSLREIGERTGLSESRICKIHTRLLERLAERLSGLAEWQ